MSIVKNLHRLIHTYDLDVEVPTAHVTNDREAVYMILDSIMLALIQLKEEK